MLTIFHSQTLKNTVISLTKAVFESEHGSVITIYIVFVPTFYAVLYTYLVIFYHKSHLPTYRSKKEKVIH